MDTYFVTVSNGTDTRSYEVEDAIEDEACATAVSCFFYDYPGSRNVRVLSSVIQSPPVANTAQSQYTAYGAPSARPGAEYTPYSAATDSTTSTYTPYSQMEFSDVAEEAGFTTGLPQAPVPETSYHQTLDNGYAPYRSFRVKLTR